MLRLCQAGQRRPVRAVGRSVSRQHARGTIGRQRRLISLQTAANKAHAARMHAAKIGDAPIALLQQVCRGQGCAAAVIHIHPGIQAHVFIRLTQDHMRKIADARHHLRRCGRGRQDQAIHLFAQHQLRHGFKRALPAVCNQQMIPMRLRHLLDSILAAAEKGIIKGPVVPGVQHHADCPSQAADQAARQGIGMIIQLRHGAVYPFAGFGSDDAFFVNDAGYGGRVHPGQAGDVTDCSGHFALLFPSLVNAIVCIALL